MGHYFLSDTIPWQLVTIPWTFQETRNTKYIISCAGLIFTLYRPVTDVPQTPQLGRKWNLGNPDFSCHLKKDPTTLLSGPRIPTPWHRASSSKVAVLCADNIGIQRKDVSSQRSPQSTPWVRPWFNSIKSCYLTLKLLAMEPTWCKIHVHFSIQFHGTDPIHVDIGYLLISQTKFPTTKIPCRPEKVSVHGHCLYLATGSWATHLFTASYTTSSLDTLISSSLM